MQMSPKRQLWQKKPRFQRRTVFAKNLGFGVGFGYRNNTSEFGFFKFGLIRFGFQSRVPVLFFSVLVFAHQRNEGAHSG